MGEYQDQARQLRPIIERAVSTGDLTDDQKIEATNLFPEWSGGAHFYAIGDYVKYDGLLYRCVQAHNSQSTWTPPASPSLWSRASDPGEEWPAWIQPTGGHDAYAAGSKVSHDDKHWISDVNNNVWEPGVYGWTEA